MSTSHLKIEQFIQLQNRNALSHAIRTCVELGIIGALRAGQRTAQQLATELNLNPTAIEQLMNVLTATELIEKYGEDYALSTVARLIPDQFYDFGDQHWRHLTAYVRTGTPLPVLEGVVTTDFDYMLNKASEEWTLTPTALSAAQALDLGNSRKGLKILEIGCGSAVFGATLVHADSSSVITLLDSPPGLERAKKMVQSIGLEEQVVYAPSESWEELSLVTELQGQKFDLVLMAGQLHRWSMDRCRQVFAQLFTLIKPDHELALIDVFPGQEKGEKQRAIFELELGLRTSQGSLHDPLELEVALKETGFGQIQFAHLPTDPYYWGLILAQKG